MDLTANPGWRVTGATVRGAIHVRRGRPNQDAIAWLAPEASNDPCILAIADGHGAPLHFRSHRGSRFAVRSAVAVLRRFARSNVATDNRSAVHGMPPETLARELVQAWKAQVSADIARRPLAEWELDEIADRVPSASIDRLDADPMLAYGSTLIAALILPDSVLYLQLGDGDIHVLRDEDASSHSPLPHDPLLLGDQTTSLCSPDSWRHVQMCIQPVDAKSPSCVMLSTDGYANSFVDAKGLSQAAADLCGIAHDRGLLELALSLPGWLRGTSAQGSGDDITVGLVVRNVA